MKVKIKVWGLLCRRFPGHDPEQGMEIEVPEGACVHDLLSHLRISKSEGGVVVADGLALKGNSRLRDGMCIHLFPLLSGG